MKEQIERPRPTYGLAELINKRINLEGLDPEILSIAMEDLNVTEPLDQDELIYQFGQALRRHAAEGRKLKARTALQLHLLSSLAYLRHRGMHPSPKDFFSSNAHDAEIEPAEAKRFVDAIQLWVVKYGYPFSLIEQVGPDLLGEIAQSGTVQSKADAQAWRYFISNFDRAEVRKEIKRKRELVSAKNK